MAIGDRRYEIGAKMKEKLRFDKLNQIILIIGIIVVTVGYIIMLTGDNTLSPILLIIAYVVIIPISLLIKSKKEKL